jgi:hypothetical protein
MKRDWKETSGSFELLSASDPVRHAALVSEGIEGALEEIGAAITSRPPRAGRSRSKVARRKALLVAATVFAIGAGVAAGAVVFGAHTGLFPTKSDAAMGGPGEALDPTAPDFREVALQIASDIPYPEGYDSWREWVLETQVPTSGDGTTPGGSESPFSGGVVSTGALHGWFAASAFCAWVQSWRQASIAGDANATAQGAQTIAGAPGWKAVTDEDPHPDPSAANDPGAASGTLFGWMLPYRDAVLVGDRARVEKLLASGYGGGQCWLSDPVWMAKVRAHGEEWGRLSQKELTQKYEQFLANGRS